MKKIVILIITITRVKEQENSIRFGVKGGLNIANLSKNGMYQDFLGRDYKSILGFHVGGLVEIPISKKLLFNRSYYFLNKQLSILLTLMILDLMLILKLIIVI